MSLSSENAPSAIRCIKTYFFACFNFTLKGVRKHRAPNAALRPDSRASRNNPTPPVRKGSVIGCKKFVG